ncbi:protein E18 [Elephant endotheliotropic herpesvirus 2]|nr:protein E18 [Elephant endotheliotropic herpesvirus 2]
MNVTETHWFMRIMERQMNNHPRLHPPLTPVTEITEAQSTDQNLITESTSSFLRLLVQMKMTVLSLISEKRLRRSDEDFPATGLTLAVSLFFISLLVYLLITKGHRSRKYIILQQFMSFLLAFAFLIFSDDINLCSDWNLAEEYRSALLVTYSIYSLKCTCIHLYGVYTIIRYNTYDTYVSGFLTIIHASMITVLTVSQTRAGAILQCDLMVDLIYLIKWCVFTVLAALVISVQTVTSPVLINAMPRRRASTVTLLTVFSFLSMIACRDFLIVVDHHWWSSFFAKTTLILGVMSLAEISIWNTGVNLECFISIILQ